MCTLQLNFRLEVRREGAGARLPTQITLRSRDSWVETNGLSQRNLSIMPTFINNQLPFTDQYATHRNVPRTLILGRKPQLQRHSWWDEEQPDRRDIAWALVWTPLAECVTPCSLVDV
jgi:hypothetical protein